MNRGGVIIPARWRSSRFPGKPLANIHGKPMIEWVYQKCCAAVKKDQVFVATDDVRISDAVTKFGGNVVMTSSECLTGTDRIVEANKTLGWDFAINVQGDEPMLESAPIKLAYDIMSLDSSAVLNFYTDIDKDEISSPNVPKVAVSEGGNLLYMSRGGIPFDKGGEPRAEFKQVCIYGFSDKHLRLLEKRSKKTSNESVEDIEILRFLELDVPVRMLWVARYGHAVDTEEDLAKVRALMK